MLALLKTQIGQSLPDYINKIRVDHAKELLKNTTDTIGSIAGRVGYMSSNSFIRIFKKIEGITPGQYRDSVEP